MSLEDFRHLQNENLNYMAINYSSIPVREEAQDSKNKVGVETIKWQLLKRAVYHTLLRK